MLAYLSLIFHAGPVKRWVASVSTDCHYDPTSPFLCFIHHACVSCPNQAFVLWNDRSWLCVLLVTKTTPAFTAEACRRQESIFRCRAFLSIALIILPSCLITNPYLLCAPEPTPKEAEVPRRFSLATSLSASSTTRTKGTWMPMFPFNTHTAFLKRGTHRLFREIRQTFFFFL